MSNVNPCFFSFFFCIITLLHNICHGKEIPMITISVCMIVKNEEAVLARCLDSLRGLYEELIIVDTGSTDRTMEIAAGYTDRIYSFAWTGNFSDARNYSFSHASCDYIYCVDADEVLDDANRSKFFALKQSLDPSADIVQMYYTNQLMFNTVYNYDEELRPKLYRRTFRPVFEGPVHEAVPITDHTVILESDIRIRHMPQSSHVSRDLAIFAATYGDGTPIPWRLHTQYARELFIGGTEAEFLVSEPIFRNSILREDATETALKEACCVLSHIAVIRQDIPGLLKYSLKAVALEGCSEIFFELGNYYLNAKDYEEAAIWFYNAAFESSSLLNIHYCTDYPLSALASTYDLMGHPAIGAEYRARLEQWKSSSGSDSL